MNPEQVRDSIVTAFNEADWPTLLTFHHPNPGDPDGKHALSYTKTLRGAGFRISATTVKPYVEPKWSIFRSQMFQPTPDTAIECVLTNEKGGKQQLYYAIADAKICHYVQKPKAPKAPKEADPGLDADLLRIKEFVIASVADYLAGDPLPVSAVETLFSVEEGYVGIAFQSGTPYSPGKFGFTPFAELMFPHWNARSRKIKKVGNALVEVLTSLNAEGAFAALPKVPKAEIQVEEQDGIFGWPLYEDRFKENLLR